MLISCDSWPRTKIIATMGPAISTKASLKKLVKAGVSVFRLNFSHGSLKDHERYVRLVNQVSKELGVPVGVLCDFQGPKLRIGRFEKPGGVILQPDQSFVIVGRDVRGTERFVSGPSPDFFRFVKRGEHIFLNDGLIRLSVEAIKGSDVHCQVIEGGNLSDNKGINLPSSSQEFKIPTPKDKSHVRFAVDQGLSLFAFSFIQTPTDVTNIRRYLKQLGWEGLLISKIEKPMAVENLDEIIQLSDGVLVARGDLGVEMQLEKVPRLQKEIIRQCNRNGKVVITATQMLESMVMSPRPTRAEVSDVANAVYDGTDAVMLSSETASGRYPLKAVAVMRAIVSEAEALGKKTTDSLSCEKLESIARVVTVSAVHAAEVLHANVIACHTQTGRTALWISKFHPTMPVVAFTPRRNSYYQMALFYGVIPVFLERPENVDEMIRKGDQALIRHRVCKKGDRVVLVFGEAQTVGSTNMIRIQQL